MNTVPTLQDQFDRMAVHLLTQKERSFSNETGTCAYRSDDEGAPLMCAIGKLIKEDCYDRMIEGDGVIAESTVKVLQRSGEADEEDVASLFGPAELTPRMRMFQQMQHVHDDFDIKEWKEQLIKLADKFNLSTAAIDNFNPN